MSSDDKHDDVLVGRMRSLDRESLLDATSTFDSLIATREIRRQRRRTYAASCFTLLVLTATGLTGSRHFAYKNEIDRVAKLRAELEFKTRELELLEEHTARMELLVLRHEVETTQNSIVDLGEIAELREVASKEVVMPDFACVASGAYGAEAR